MTDKHVTIIGGGVAGLSTALDLAGFGVQVDVIERSVFMGGHAIQYTCKATEACVKCGACMAETQLKKAVDHPLVRLRTGSCLEKIRPGDRLALSVSKNPLFINPDACDNCGLCFNACPADSIQRGVSSNQNPFFALNPKTCLRNSGEECEACKEACPRDAVILEGADEAEERLTDALVFATGFKAYDPTDKPYGYGVFKNVITNLELEKMLRGQGNIVRPSDGAVPTRAAFVQCVGSRDASLGHLWCSQVCCGSALRMARLLKSRQPEIEITIFYIDIQTFGKDFESFYAAARDEFNFQRSIPGDIFENQDHSLSVTYADDTTHESCEAPYDMVVLSIGMQSNPDNVQMVAGLGLETTATGFFESPCAEGSPGFQGVFAAGAATGPMSIAETIASAGRTASMVMSYLTTGSA